MENLNNETYNDFISSGKVLVDVWADWCGPCKSMLPILEQLDNETDDLKVGKLDAGNELELARSLGVRAIPAFILYKDGKIIDKKTGALRLEDLKNFVNQN